jgi:hypothetical protein
VAPQYEGSVDTVRGGLPHDPPAIADGCAATSDAPRDVRACTQAVDLVDRPPARIAPNGISRDAGSA